MDVRIPQDARQRIVGRMDGVTTRLTLSEIQSADELAFAIRYLMDYYTYKGSKGNDGVNTVVSGEAFRAAGAAMESFEVEIPMARIDEVISTVDVPLPVSPLTDGVVANPYQNVVQD